MSRQDVRDGDPFALDGERILHMVSSMKLLTLFLALLASLATSLASPLIDRISTLHAESGGNRNAEEDAGPTLAATVMALRAMRYSGVEMKDTKFHQAFLLSCYRPEVAAFVENGAGEPTVLANSFALMLMGELGMPEDVHAVSARDYLVENAETLDEIYMAMAGMQVMGLADEVPASWMKTMMDTAVSEEAPAYDKARAIVTCMRTGFNLPDYSLFLEPIQSTLKEVTADADFHKDAKALQATYTLARALMMIDGRCDLVLPDLDAVATESPPVMRLYKLAALHAWAPKLKGKITVAICTGFAPVGFRDETGQIAGMDADLMRTFAEESGYEVTFVERVVFDGIWELPARGLTDAAVSGLSKRRDRLRPGIRWSHPYFNVERSLSILKSNADRFRSVADLSGMKIAVTAGTTGERDTRERNPQAVIVPYDNEATAIRDLLAGKVHALARGDVSNRYDARIHQELAVIDAHPMVPVEEFVVAVSSERVALGQKLDRWLRECRRNGRLDQMFARYVGNDDLPGSTKGRSVGP